MHQFHQLIVLALFNASLLDGGLRQMALFQQSQRFYPLLDLHPFSQPRLPLMMGRVDRFLRSQHLGRLSVLQTIRFL
jgi:hypothetical protein